MIHVSASTLLCVLNFEFLFSFLPQLVVFLVFPFLTLKMLHTNKTDEEENIPQMISKSNCFSVI